MLCSISLTHDIECKERKGTKKRTLKRKEIWSDKNEERKKKGRKEQK